MAIKAVPLDMLRDTLGLEETAERGGSVAVAKPFSCGTLPNEWTVMFISNFGWASDRRLIELSRFGLAIGCRHINKSGVIETVALAACYGEELWRISAYGNDFAARGTLPELSPAMRQKLMTVDRSESSLEEIHSIPVEVAEVICGFRADVEHQGFVGLRPIPGSPFVHLTPKADIRFPSRDYAFNIVNGVAYAGGAITIILLVVAIFQALF